MNEWQIEVEKDRYNHAEAIDFLSKAFGPDYFSARYYKTRLFAVEPSFRPENLVSARVDGHRLAGLLRIVERELLIDGIPLKTGFITSVAVHPDQRGQGLGSAIVRYALDLLVARGFDLAGVHGRRAVDGFYPKFGFVHVGRYLDLEIISQVNPTEGIETIPIGPEDIPLITQYYQDTYSPLTGSIQRDKGVWRFLLAKVDNSGDTCRLLGLQRDESLIGYIATMGADLIEAAVGEEYISQLPGVLVQLGLKRMCIHPRHPLFIHCRRHYSTLLQERFALDGGYMAKLLSPRSVLEKLSKRLKDRAAMWAVPASKFCLSGYAVDLASGRVAASSAEADIGFDNEAYAVQMILGFQSLSRIKGVYLNRGGSLPERLFPGYDFHSAVLDEV